MAQTAPISPFAVNRPQPRRPLSQSMGFRDPAKAQAQPQLAPSAPPAPPALPKALNVSQRPLSFEREAIDLPLPPPNPVNPHHYSPAQIEYIMAGLARAWYLHEMVSLEGMPGMTQWQRQISDDPNLRARSARARLDGADWLVAECDRLIETATPFTIPVVREKIQHLRWRAQRLNPAMYGDRSQLEITGGLNVNVRLVDEAPAWLASAVEGAGPILEGRLLAQEGGQDAQVTVGEGQDSGQGQAMHPDAS